MSAFDPIARAIVAALVLGIVESAAFAFGVAALTRVLRTTATTRHVLWWIVLGSTVVLPAATCFVSLRHIEHLAPAAPAAAAPLESRAPGTARDALTADRPATAVHLHLRAGTIVALRAVPNEPANRGAAWSADSSIAPAQRFFERGGVATALVALWLAIAALRLTLLANGAFALVRIKRAAIPLDDAVARRLRRYRHTTRASRSAALLVSADVDVPIAVGFGRPAIIVPMSVVDNETTADLDQIVMHEHAHLDRYDDLTNFVQCVLERLCWFNPVTLCAGRRIALEREIACDDTVVAHTGRAHRYATCLWKLVQATRLPVRPLVAPGALGGPRQITQRIEQLLDSKRNALPRLSPITAFVLGAFVTAAIFVQAQHAPQISIADASPVPSPSARSTPAALSAAPVRRTASIAKPALAARKTVVAQVSVPAAAPPPPPVPSVAPVPAIVPSPSPSIASDLQSAERTIETDPRIDAATRAEIARALAEAKRDSQRAVLERRDAERVARAMARASAEMQRRRARDGERYDAELNREIRDSMRTADFAHMDARIGSTVSQLVDGSLRDAGLESGSAVAVADEGIANHRNLPSFHAIVSEGSADIVVVRGATPSVDFQGDRELAERTEVSVEDGRLIIDQTRSLGGWHRPILVSVPALDAVSLDGSSDVSVTGVAASQFSVRIEGSGNARVSGTIANLHVAIDGSGNADLTGVSATAADIHDEGSGDVKLRAPDTLHAHLSGSGSLSLIGTPKHSFATVDGSGEIVHL